LPQKRRTLSSGFSQYQHEPFGGSDWRLLAGVDDAGKALWLGGSSCLGSTVFPLTDTDSAYCTLPQRP